LPPLQSGASLNLPTGQIINPRSSLSPPKPYDQIPRKRDFLFLQSAEGSVIPEGAEEKRKITRRV